MSAKSYLRADPYASLASDHHRLPRRERKREFTVPDFSSSRRRDGVNGDVRKPDSRYPRPICGEFPDLARVSMTEGDGAFDGGARLNYALVPPSAWQAGVGIPGFVRILSCI